MEEKLWKLIKKATKNNYKKIVAFEPDHENAEVLKKTAGNIVVVEAAVYSHNTELYFQTGDGSSSRVSDAGIKVMARAIDMVAECRDASFIKMDIEGSEYDALLGAKDTIMKNKPILAICIYHSDEDMLRILELIYSWNLGYKFYVRHHAQKISETVLYAVP
ncbi:MAG: FkbM family methyltransferase [Lachnospiraceae bacterium]|nr:FkbM family methyltransferase [Lachnospiraceae bacterium]